MAVRLTRLVALVRGSDWWDFKLLTIVLLFAATARVAGVPVWPMLPAAALVLLALLPGAVFASVINDLTDVAEDRRAGKRNALAALPPWVGPAILAATTAVGLAVMWAWRDDPLLCAVYLAAWLMFVVYSVPPFRWKARGGWGVIAMGLGEATLPSLTVVLAAFRAAGASLDPVWTIAVTVWCFCHGTRAILWHQLGDEQADADAGVVTFVGRRGASFVLRLARYAIFPCELAALAAMLARLGTPLPVLALAGYLIVAWLGVRILARVPIIVAPLPNHYYLMQDYYIAWLPAAVLAACVVHDPRDLWTAALFLLIFPRPPIRIGRETVFLIRAAIRRRRRRPG